MDRLLPKFEDFVRLEQKTLTLLRNELCRQARLAHIGNDIQRTLALKSRSPFAFCTYWDVEYLSNECRVFLGGRVGKEARGGKISDMSYYVCVAKGRESPIKILRKFHFDYVTEGRMHPRFHLQYGGELAPPMKKLGVTEKLIEELHPKVREPRILFPPMTVGLLINTIFYEFPTDETKVFREGHAWRQRVCENEKTVLEPFYSKCAILAKKCDTVLFDHAYVR